MAKPIKDNDKGNDKPKRSMQAKNMAKRIIATIGVLDRCKPSVAQEVNEILLESTFSNSDREMIKGFNKRLHKMAHGEDKSLGHEEDD